MFFMAPCIRALGWQAALLIYDARFDQLDKLLTTTSLYTVHFPPLIGKLSGGMAQTSCSPTTPTQQFLALLMVPAWITWEAAK